MNPSTRIMDQVLVIHCGSNPESGLAKNLQPPSIALLKWMQHTSEILYAVKDFPCTYLAFLLLFQSYLLPLIDKDVDHLPGWKASLMNIAGCPSQPLLFIYLMIGLDLPI